jgi:uncharacterized protein YbaA (DUF1428 family)
MTYVDGFVLVVPKTKLAAYKKLTKEAGPIWMKHGALQYVECVGDDMTPEWCPLPFPKLANCKKTELPIFSFIVYKNRKHRDQVNKKVMLDPYMQKMDEKKNPMPFDMKRMSYGGFEVLTAL